MATSGRYPIHQLVESDDHLEELCEFLAGGGDPNQKAFGNNTLLHVAAQSNQLNERVVQKLINAGADIELTTSVGSTPLQFAVMSRNREAVQALIKAGAKINVRNSFGRTPLHYAVYSCHPRRHIPWMNVVHNTPDLCIVKWLLDEDDTDVNPVDSDGETPLMWAVKHRSLEAVKKLLKRGANPNIPNQQAQNCLHVALSAQNPNRNIVTKLLMYGTGIYDADKYGQSPVDILLQNVMDNATFHFTMECLERIALKYTIREDFERKLRRIPQCLEFLRKACQEVKWMNKKIIYDNITLHDFACGCFQERGIIYPPLEIYKPVVDILLSGKSKIYFNDLLHCMSTRNLCCVLGNILPPAFQLPCSMMSELAPYQSHHVVFECIKECVETAFR